MEPPQDPQLTWRPETEFVANFRPRVERNAPMSIYMRAQKHQGPGSTAWATPDMALGSVSIALTLSKSMSQASVNSTYSVPKKLSPTFGRPPALIPIGEKRNRFQVSEHAPLLPVP